MMMNQIDFNYSSSNVTVIFVSLCHDAKIWLDSCHDL